VSAKPAEELVSPAKRGRLKWEPTALLIIVVGLGVWLVAATRDRFERQDDHQYSSLRLGPMRGVLEMSPEDPSTGQSRFRVLMRGSEPSRWHSESEIADLIGRDNLDALESQGDNVWFRLFNITTWTSLWWVLLGFGAQAIFMSRMVIQWVVSERKRESIVPASFWYISFLGGLLLFVYFVWRQDIVGVLGQTSGVVIYARNIRLIHKQRRRDARRNAEKAALTPDASDKPGE